jgi:hypothetical protein
MRPSDEELSYAVPPAMCRCSHQRCVSVPIHCVDVPLPIVFIEATQEQAQCPELTCARGRVERCGTTGIVPHANICAASFEVLPDVRDTPMQRRPHECRPGIRRHCVGGWQAPYCAGVALQRHGHGHHFIPLGTFPIEPLGSRPARVHPFTA